MKQVCVVYEETRSGRNALRMAVDAARAFGGSSLQVFVAVDAVGEQLLGKSAGSALEQQLMRVQRAIADVAGNDVRFIMQTYVPPAAPALPENALLVLPRAPKTEADGDEQVPRLSQTFATAVSAVHRPDTLMPADEVGLEDRRKGPILVPFSDGETGLFAASAAFELALQWRKQRYLDRSMPEVIFYHTTWPDPNGLSSDPIDQICDEATRVMLAIEAEAERLGVRYRTVIETHDDVVQGAIDMAQSSGTVLIVMARGARIRQGSYVGRTLQQSPIPVFIAGCQTKAIGAPADDRQVAAFNQRRRQALQAKAEAPGRPWYKRIHETPVLRSPMFVAGVVALAYVIKAAAKIGVGSWINSPMVSGDGFHNIADVLEIIAIGVVLFITARQASERYPYGRKNMEWFTQLGIGIGLFIAAGNFVIDCAVGLLSYVPLADQFVRSLVSLPVHEPVHMTSETFPWVLGVTSVSFLVSLVLSRYQIIVGKRTGHASLIANGEETRSDGWIECVTVVGVIAQFVTGWGFLEYPLGLLVAFLIMRTAKELFLDGWRVLLQHSIGVEHESAVRAACQGVSGVSGVGELKTFQVGHTAVVMVTCQSLAGGHGMTYIKQAVEAAIRNYLVADEDSEFKGADVHVKMQRPDPARHRIGFGLVVNAAGDAVLAPSFQEATHIAVCDVEHDDIVRSKVLPFGLDRVEQLLDKRVQRLYVFGAHITECRRLEQLARQRLAFNKQDIQPMTSLHEANAYVLPVLGLAV